MIYGTKDQSSALDYVRNSANVFHLTGSRFFGTETENSDWDFFIQMDEKISSELEQKGFRLETESYKEDPNIVQVWKKENVHIQLVNNVKAKEWVQWCLSNYFRLYKPNKDQAKLLWRTAMKLYLDGYNACKFKLF